MPFFASPRHFFAAAFSPLPPPFILPLFLFAADAYTLCRQPLMPMIFDFSLLIHAYDAAMHDIH